MERERDEGEGDKEEGGERDGEMEKRGLHCVSY